MASLSADLGLATAIIALTSRTPSPASLYRLRTAVHFPLLCKPAVSFSTSSFRSGLLALDFAKPRLGSRSRTVASSAATTSQESDTSDFGEVDIDGSLVAAKTTGAEDIVMLNNGCLCCTVRGDLVRMISELVERKKGKFDHIVIETTGLANPAPIIQTFYAEDKIFNDVKLDGVVTLVDAKHAGFHLDEIKPKGVVNEAIEQIAYADRIIVNKTDLVGEPEIVSLVQRVRKINSLAELKRTKFGQVDLDYVLGVGEHHHDHHAHDHTHDPGVSSVSIVCEGSLDLEKANMWLGTLLMERSEDIYRMKGLLSVQGMDERFVFQGVHDIFQGSPDRLWGTDEPRVNKIVFIGKNLDAKELESGFKSCLL
ncbi:hypothetical protein G4B88_005027 [Cannabis sativa]|uniref:CobW C-terminal domain-containing protein n=1 Tax=Cannabis sativa TaxID=3483 RepID=A0A7J6H6P0_CANSA|nr:hypothetical protein G4B88_005027 [Cannabis sativa]